MTTIEQRVEAMFADGYGDTLVARLDRTIGPGDTPEMVLVAYKQFLVLKAENDDFDATKMSPPPVVDQMWHLHILDTRHYADSCLQAFGRVMHHDPDGSVDLAARAARIGSTYLALTTRFGMDFEQGIWIWNMPGPPPKARARAAPIENAATPAVIVDNSVTFSIKDLTAEVFFYTFQKTTKLETVFNKYSHDYSQRRGFPSTFVRFIFNAQDLHPSADDQTLEEIGMEDGGQMHAILNLKGC